MRVMFQRLLRWGMRHGSGKWLILGGIVGVVSGVVGIAFFFATHLVSELLLTEMAGFSADSAGWRIGAVGTRRDPADELAADDFNFSWWWIGRRVTGESFCSECAPVQAWKRPLKLFISAAAVCRLAAPVTKFFASIATLGCGGSAGREGPIAMIGAGFGSFIGPKLGLASRDCRILLAAGIAGGIVGYFPSTIGGALIACEVCYRDSDVEADELIPSFISAIIARCVFLLGEDLILPLLSVKRRWSPAYSPHRR